MGKKVINIVMQIDETQHLSEERVIVNYTDSEGDNPEEMKTKILPYKDLSTGDKSKYDDLKSALTALI